MARKFEEVPSVSNNFTPMPASPSSLPLTSLPSPPPSEPSLRLLPVREVVDIERYDPEAPIELIPEGYVKQYVIDDNDNGHTNIVLLEDPSYNGYRPKKRLAKERPDTPNKFPRDNVPQTRPWQKITSSPVPTGLIPHPPRRSRAQGGQVLIPERIPRLAPYSQSQEATPVPTDRKHNWAAESGHNAGWRKDGTKNGIELDGDDEHDEDYRGDDEDETEYAGSGGTETDTEGERKFASGISGRNIHKSKSSQPGTRYPRHRTRLQVIGNAR